MSKDRTRILFDAHSLLGKKTGVGYYTYHLVKALSTNHSDDIELVGYYHNFLYRKKTPDLPTAPNIHYRRVAFIPGQIVNLLRRYRILLPVELLTLMKADFILYPNFLGLSGFFKTPQANVIHDLTYIDLPDYVARKNLSDLRRFIPNNIQRARFIITVSDFAKKRIMEEFNVSANDILVTPIPPTPPTVFTKTKQTEALKGLGITGKYLLTLSTVEPRKNVLGMLDAYLFLPEELQKEYTLVITGAIGWNCETEVARLNRLKKAGKNVIHLGYVTDEQKSALYQGATFYTSASHYEGFGMTPLEAMSYGTPCALSDIPVFHEAAGDAALFFNKDNPRAIARAWQKMLRDPALRKRLSAAGEHQAASYGWQDVAESLYNKIMQTLEQPRK